MSLVIIMMSWSLKMVWHYYVDAERVALEHLIIEFSYKEAV